MKNKKYLMTFAWSRTVEIELPEGVSVDDIENMNPPKEVDQAVCQALKDGANEFRWKDLIVTDLQESE